MKHSVSIEIGGRTLTLETGRVARQASGAVTVQYGDTVVLVTAVASKEPIEARDFFPLLVDYREKSYAAGRIPGGFFKREGRPTEKEVLSSRLIDRPMRPLFPKNYRKEVQVIATVLSSDQENDSDVLALIGTSSALMISEIPFHGPVSALRIGAKDGSFMINPTFKELETSDLDIVVAERDGSVVMVEGAAKDVPESLVLGGLRTAIELTSKINQLQIELARAVGKPKEEVPPEETNVELESAVRGFAEKKIGEAIRIPDKEEREEAISSIQEETVGALSERYPEREALVRASVLEIERTTLRDMILKEGKRADGRRSDEIRSISCEVGVLPRTHGSAIFTRGQTQCLAVTTLGTSTDEQRVEELEGRSWKSYMLHYNFPPFSVGEVKPMRGPGRREIGHGALAERAIQPVLPDDNVFPYTIRIVSDILESNGSSSMATVCGGSLSLMDAGVPIKAPVAGIAMGLVKENEQVAILTDILGVEDHLGDMDFKVAGTRNGITAFQMDVKIPGIGFDLLESALEKAREARLFVLGEMEKVIGNPRGDLSPYAPRIIVIQVAQEKVKDIIGPGGRMIRKIIEETGAEIDIEDNGEVKIAAYTAEGGERAVEIIKGITDDPEVGKLYQGKVRKIMEFGAFVEVTPGRDGLVHISELDVHRVKRVEDVLKEGDTVLVKVIGIDKDGKIKLSRKAALSPEGAKKG
ncbi:MAG: polyribonucleotide nucleotidyltransferase [Candidatus Eisenbacteria bacterium]|nr:polyribonucleotide nucleotidyltransferase [Candidatus Eisenbacteria bacterium]